jgi:CO/xanthine dehydrogenase FAD-binding subunit
MRSYLPSFAMRRARSLGETVDLLAANPGSWRPFAGGTDLMVQLAAGVLAPGKFVNIWGIEELRRIEVTEDAVRIGALVTFTDVQRDATLRREFPLLCRAAAETGGIANQNRATLGGNIANASPAADTPPALLVYDAEIELASVRGSRRIPYAAFHTGYKTMDLQPDELIASVLVPRRTAGWVHQYRKVGARRAQAISKVCFAAAARVEGGFLADVRLAFGSVGPIVIRLDATERLLRQAGITPQAIAAAVESAASEIAPIDDIRSTARYRLRVAGNLVSEFLRSLHP